MEIHKTIVARPRGWTNFIDFHDDKVIYRRYAGLYFCLGENEKKREKKRKTKTSLLLKVLTVLLMNWQRWN